MARDLITPVKTTDMSTGTNKLTTSNMVKISTANGLYIKTTGIDPTRLLFVVTRTTVGGATTGTLEFLGGSTSGNDDYEPGAYSTGRNVTVKCPLSSVAARKYTQYIQLKETARFLDSNNYINIDPSTAMSSKGGTTELSHIGAIYLGK